MTFAITTKSGRSVNIKADNYKEAQKYADRHFGKGCIVQLVGNATAAWENQPASSNAIVNAALAWKEKAATNAKFKVGDYVLYEGHGEGYRRGRIVSLGGSIGSAGCVVEWVGGGRDSVPYARLTPCNSAASDPTVAANATPDILGYVKRAPYAKSVSKSGDVIHYTSADFRRENKDQVRRKVEDYLAKRVNLAACWVFFGPEADPDDIYDAETFLRVDIPAKAVRNSAVAANKDAEIKGNGKPTDGSYLLARPYYEIFRDGRMIYACRAWEDVKEAIKKGYQYRVVNSTAVAANAGVREGNYQVTIETVDFSGNRTQSKNLTASQLKTWLSLIHCDGSDTFLDEIASSSRREVQFFLDMHPTVRIKAM